MVAPLRIDSSTVAHDVRTRPCDIPESPGGSCACACAESIPRSRGAKREDALAAPPQRCTPGRRPWPPNCPLTRLHVSGADVPEDRRGTLRRLIRPLLLRRAPEFAAPDRLSVNSTEPRYPQQNPQCFSTTVASKLWTDSRISTGLDTPQPPLRVSPRHGPSNAPHAMSSLQQPSWPSRVYFHSDLALYRSNVAYSSVWYQRTGLKHRSSVLSGELPTIYRHPGVDSAAAHCRLFTQGYPHPPRSVWGWRASVIHRRIHRPMLRVRPRSG